MRFLCPRMPAINPFVLNIFLAVGGIVLKIQAVSLRGTSGAVVDCKDICRCIPVSTMRCLYRPCGWRCGALGEHGRAQAIARHAPPGILNSDRNTGVNAASIGHRHLVLRCVQVRSVTGMYLSARR